MAPTPHPALASARSFHTVVRAVVPAAASLDPEGWSRLEAIVGDALAERSPGERRAMGVFLRLLGGLSLLRFGRPLGRLDDARARRLLHSLQGARLLLLRRGVWAVRTLAFMGYYGQPAVQEEIGYRAAAGGWQARGRPDA